VAAFRIAPLTPARWADFVGLFGPRGACAGCWCLFPRLTSPEWKTQGGSNRRAMKRIVDAGDPPGLLAYHGDQAVGWVAVAPRGQRYAPTFAWHGLMAAFRAAGFKEVARRSATRPIMRKRLSGRPRAAARG